MSTALVIPITAASGAYFADCNVAKPRKDTENAETAKTLWEVSEKVAAAVEVPLAGLLLQCVFEVLAVLRRGHFKKRAIDLK